MKLFSRPRRAAILGCGPAGIFAAHAFAEAGWDITIYSRKRSSRLYGAQYLHAPIPGLPEIKTVIDYRLIGTAEGYAAKVYGSTMPADAVSPATLVGPQDAWDIRTAYREAYARYERYIVETNVTPMMATAEFGYGTGASRYWGAVLSSVPAPALCALPRLHAFLGQKVFAAGDAPELDIYSPVSCDPDTILCNGMDDRAWYRVSNVFGHSTAEWPESRRPPFEGVAEFTKPIGNTCTCFPRITRIGRYGAWNKTALSHHAYQAAQAIIQGRG